MPKSKRGCTRERVDTLDRLAVKVATIAVLIGAGCHESNSSASIKDAAGDPPLPTDRAIGFDVANDPAPPREGCERSSSVCNANTVTYVCGPSDYPPDSECMAADQRAGEVTRCCRLRPSLSTCTADPEGRCAGDELYYSCGGWDTPAQADDLICDEVGPERSGRNGFCCRRFRSTSCTLTPAETGCVGTMYVFTCDLGDSPDQDDRKLDCHPRDNSPTDYRVYCCNAHKPLAI